MSLCTIIACSAVLVASDVTVSTLDGKQTVGNLRLLDEDQVVIAASDNGEMTIPIADVMTVQFGSPNKNLPDDSSNIILFDGSSFPVESLIATAEILSISSSVMKDLEIPRDDVRAVRIGKAKDEWQPQWKTFLLRNNDKDMLVVEKRDGTGLDFLAGVVGSVSEETVNAIIGGNEVPVPRSRLYGFILAKRQSQSVATTRIEFSSDAAVIGRDVFLEDDLLSFETSWGQFVEVDAKSVRTIDYSSGRIHYLSDLDPIEERYFGLEPPGQNSDDLFEQDRSTRDGISSPWKMSRDRFPNSGRPPLTIKGNVFRKGLCIFPSAEVAYALDNRYSTLNAMVGIDDDVAFNQANPDMPTAVELRVEADGEQIAKKLIRANSEPWELDLDVDGVNTLTLFVDFGDNSSVCDYLDLGDAKLIVKTED